MPEDQRLPKIKGPSEVWGLTQRECAIRESHEADGLLRVWWVREGLDRLLWDAADPLVGIDGAIAGLRNARTMFVSAGFECRS